MTRHKPSRGWRSKRSSARRATPSTPHRRLTLESLEDRRLLAFTDLAVIEGSLLYDLPGTVDQPIPGQPVRLYRDGNGNGAFDGAATDPLQGTQLTDAGGYYRFDTLSAATYFLEQPPEPSGYLQPPPERVVRTIVITPADADGNQGLTIDAFADHQALVAQRPPAGVATVYESMPAPTAIGGQRTLIVNALSGGGSVRTAIFENGESLFSYAEAGGVVGNAIVIWDGTAGQHTEPVRNGLGGVDLTGGGAQDSFELTSPVTDVPAVGTITVYTDATHASEAVFTVPIFTTQAFRPIKFAGFTVLAGYGPADFTNVGAITFQVNKDPDPLYDNFGLDYQLEAVATVGPTILREDLPYPVTSHIGLVKLTNGTDNDAPPGPLVPVGSVVTWTYQVTNPGNESIAGVVVTDDHLAPGDQPIPVLADGFNAGDTNHSNLLDSGEAWLFTATGVAAAGQYANLGTATGTGVISSAQLTHTNPDHYFGVASAIHVEKATNGQDADTPTGPLVAAGSTATWTYAVTNPGNVPLSDVLVRDNNGTPTNPADDFNATFVGGDTNSNSQLDVGETWQYQATGIAVAGQYANVATATGIDPIGQTRTDTDPSHYFGVAAAIHVEKATNGQDADTPTGPLVAAGSVVNWTYVVTNPGNVPLSNVVVRDNNGTPANPADDFNATFVSGDVNGNSQLDVSETWQYQALGIAVAGQYANVATATGIDLIGQTQIDTDPSHYFGVASAISVEKATNGQDADTPPGPLVAVGSTVTWTYAVTNPGNVPLSNVIVRDNNGTPANPTDDFNAPFVSGDANGNDQLDVGETWQYRATGLAVAGQYANMATATGIDPIGQPRTDTDPSHYFGVASTINVEKATNNQDADTPAGPLVAAGSTVTWTYAVTNPGNVPLFNVVVRDNNGTPANPADDFDAVFIGGDTNGNNQLNIGETWQYQATGLALAGQYGNVATATGIDPIGQTPSDTDPSHYFGVSSAINVKKATNGQDADTPTGPLLMTGSVVTWTYVVTNPGNVPLSNVVVRDNNGTSANPADDFNALLLSGDTNGNSQLDPGESWLYHASGIAVAGQYGNVATATGLDPIGQTQTDTDPSHYFGVASAVNVEKATNGQDADTPTGPLVATGSTVTWTYAVTNPGNVPLSNVVVRDNNGTSANPADDFNAGFIGGDTNSNGQLDVGETWQYRATGLAVAGQYANVATATGGDPIGQTRTDTDLSHYFGVASAINVEKATNGQDADTPTGPLVAAGSVVTWTYVVTNPGNVPLWSVVVRDNNGTPANPADDFNALLLSGDTNGNSQLDPGESWQHQASGIAVAGQYGNVATATGLDPIGQPRTDTDPSHYFGVASAIDVEKATNGQDADTPTGPLVAAASVVAWTYAVTNPGNVPLSNVVVRDNNGTPANPADDFTATFVSGDTNSNSQLDVGETWQYRATGLAVAGQYANVATATGIDPIGQPWTDTDPSHYFGVSSAINVEKATNGQDADTPTGPRVAAGSTVTWTYAVTNPGNVPLSNVVVRDNNATPANPADDFNALLIDGDTNGNSQLEVGETWQYQATGIAVAGQYGNVATATGIDPIGQTRTDTDPSHYFGVASAINVKKATNGQDADTPTGPLVAVGSTVTWTYAVTNPGNVPLSNVVVRDNNGTPGNPADDFSATFVGGDTNGNSQLDMGETWQYQATGIAVAGQYGNLATATGIDPIAQTPSDTDSSHYFGVASAIDVEKATDGQDADTPLGPLVAASSTVTWTYAVTNPGNVPLSNVVVRDNNGTPANPADDFNPLFIGGDTNGNSQLDVGETWQYRATGLAVAGQYANVATATGIDPLGQTPSDTDPSHYFGVASAIHVEKATNGQDADTPTGPLAAAGGTVSWTYVVTNPGNVPLSSVVVRDDNGTPGKAADDFDATFVGGDTNGNSQLDVGEAWQYQATGIAVAGQYGNVATATGIDPIGQTPSDTDLSHYFGEAPAIDIEKATNGLDADLPTGPFVWAGSTVTWTYVVTNPGNVSLSDVVVRDDDGTPGNPADDFTPTFVGGDENGNGRLDVGEAWQYQATGTALVGLYGNAATATGIAPSGRTVDDMDPSHYFGVAGFDESDEKPFVVLGPDKNPGTPQAVRVVDSRTGQIVPEYGFVAYEDDYVGGTRVALADLDGDGIDEVITAPGRNRAPDVRVFTLEGDSVPGFPGFLASSAAYSGGVELTVADVNGDGKPDLITVPSSGASEVRVFFNRYDGLEPSKPAFKADPDIAFQAFPVVAVGGAVVAAADLGSLVGGSFVNARDGKAEIVVGTGGGTTATVAVFEVTGASPARVRTFYPFTATNPSFTGGVSLDVAWIDQNANPQQDPPDMIVGMGVNGTSGIEVWKWNISDASVALRGAIPAAFTGPSNNAPVRVAALDADGNGIAEALLAVQGPIGSTGQIQRFNITGTSPFLVQQAPPLTGFSGPWFVATSKTRTSGATPQPVPNSPAPTLLWTNTVNAYDVNNDGRATPLDVLEIINYINTHPHETALPAQQSIPPRFFDCNVDRVITPADVLFVLNSFNKTSPYTGEGEHGEPVGDTAGMSIPLDPERGPVEAPSAPWIPESGRQEALDAVGPTVVAGVEGAAPDVALPSPLVPKSSEPPLNDFNLFELEAVLEEIAAEIAAS